MNYTKILQTNKKSVWINSCELLVLHHTGWWTFDWNMNYLSINKVKSSCHYIVWLNWEIWKIGEDTDILWHTWISERKWDNNLNKKSIWIEIINDWDYFSDIQKEKVEELIIDLIKKYNIKKENLVRHKDIAPWRKVDPYDTLRNNKFTSFDDYKNSLFSKIKIMWTYEKIFKEKYWKSTIYNDLDSAINNLIDENWNIRWKEFLYFLLIWLERVKK